MKKLLLLAIASTLSFWVYASPYDSNSFGMMPHGKIMQLNVDECNTYANATGDSEYAETCIHNQKESFRRLAEIYNKHNITAASWSLCVGQAQTEESYDYLVMLACMKVVKDICKEKPDGQWQDPRLCVNSIESGAWINNPKIYQPMSN